MDPKELEKLLKVCRKYSVKSIKTASIELEIDTTQEPAPVQSTAPSVEDVPALTDEDVLLWSSAGN